MKVQVISTKGMFTHALGAEIPVWSVMHEAESIPAAADWLHHTFYKFPDALKESGIILMEVK